jgi:DNA polymerase III delta prime subunit
MSTLMPFGVIVMHTEEHIMVIDEMAQTLRRISVAMLLAACLLGVSQLRAENVYRYVDENGDIHYNATLPPEYSDRPYEIINESGIVIERIDPMAPKELEEEAEKKPEPLYTEDEKRILTDRLLVLKYHSEDDVLEAMDVEVANLGYDARILDQTHASLLKSLGAQAREAADRQRAGLPPDEETTRLVAELQGRLQNGAKAMTALKAREQQIRATFMEELERYRFLTNGGEAGSPQAGDP